MKHFRALRFPCLLLVPLLAAGCARDDASYPSLRPRAIESRGDAEPVVEVEAVKPDPALDRQIAAFRATLAALREAVTPAASRAETMAKAARGAAAGSERWIEAQVALAELDDYRAQTQAVVTEIELLAIERASALLPAYPALDAEAAAAEAALTQQTATIDRLQAGLAPA